MPSAQKFHCEHILGALINSASSVLNGHFTRKQQEKLAEQNCELQLQLEKNRQNFQLTQSMRSENLQRELNLLSISASKESGKLAREQQERLALLNQELQLQIEESRQHFQLVQSKQNAELQRELGLKNHALRLAEQQANFENLCKQAEWNYFLKTWPLMNLPSVIRAEQLLPDNTVSLRVIFARSSDPVFAKAVYPLVEQGLCEFVDLYHNEFQSENIIFYHNGFSSDVSGGAVAANIHYALNELPVIIIESNVLLDEICVSLTMWGLGSTRQSHFTVFKLPYEPHITNGSFSVKYYSELADQLLAHLKFVLGYAYDAYNLIQYDRPPLLPRVADYEYQKGERGCLLSVQELHDAIREKYEEIYASVLGDRAPDGGTGFARLPESFKECILHKLRMEYARAMWKYLSNEQRIQYLDESVKMWVALRTKDDSARDFLRRLADGEEYIPDYIDEDDFQYLEDLSALYDCIQQENSLSLSIKEVKERALDIYNNGSVLHEHIALIKRMHTYLSDEQFLLVLNESLESWTRLRTNRKTEYFLRWLACGKHCISRDDWDYLCALSELYDRIETTDKGIYGSILGFILMSKRDFNIIGEGTNRNMEPVREDVNHSGIPKPFFVMPVAQVYLFTPPGSEPAVIVCGYVQKGELNEGDSIKLVSPSGKVYTVVAQTLVVMPDGRVEQIRAGDSAQCLLRGIDISDIEPGQVLMEVPPRTNVKVRRVGDDTMITYESIG